MILVAAILLGATVSARDSTTGFAVAAGAAALRVAAAVDAGEVTVWVDPEQPPAELRREVVASRLRSDAMLLHGHVSDRVSGAPLAGARVVTRGGVSAQTNEAGYFWMHVDAALPRGEDLTIESGGHATHVITNTLILGGADTHFIVRLDRGEGSTHRDDSHKIWLHRPGGDHPHEAEPPLQQGNDAAVPEFIRVGFGCATATTCTSVEIFSLETYVKRGLNDEWIASWHQESLRAGAVAYRSYGAYHVSHPRTTDYDICSTTSCQVNDADTSLATDIAVDATAGFVLVSNGQIFRSEYSAENNNLLGDRSCSNVDRTCGDGFAGSPNAGWPCLGDPLCSGFSCFGHGRGMCQWGTQRWATERGRDWRWIVNHYYNDEGRPAGLRSAFIEGPALPKRRAVRR